jgi:hypothetical protein
MLFLAITAFGIWLGWQLHVVREGSEWIKAIRLRGGSVAMWEDRFAAAGPAFARSVPWYRRILGDRPVVYLMLYPDCPADEKDQIEAAFPDASPTLDYTDQDISVIPIVG